MVIMGKILTKKSKGSLVVEATLVFPLVIITLLFIANILNICMVHLCMQQAMNNTAKKISQDAYLVYKFAGDEKYSEFISKLNSNIDGFQEVESAATLTKDSFNNLQSSSLNTIQALDTTSHSFDNFNIFNLKDKLALFVDNLKNLFDKLNTLQLDFKSFVEAIDNLINKGKENIDSVVFKLLTDASGGTIVTSISDYVFENYRKNLNIPASRIHNLKSFNSKLLNDGSFKLIIDYDYLNPFSFVNQKSMEYSVINKTIKMRNIVAIKSFIGKQGTSLRGKFIDSPKEEQETDESSNPISGGGQGGGIR